MDFLIAILRSNLSLSFILTSLLIFACCEILRSQGELGRNPHESLETELELYPLNIVVPNDPVIKNEAMFDYHDVLGEGKYLGGIRFFADANTHWKKPRDMQDLILYTEFYFGLKNLQLGIETGSITGEEYLSAGPQFVNYDGKYFKRISIISRLFPDYVMGYEYTTREFRLPYKFTISSTGMGRTTIPANQTVLQASIWFTRLGKRLYVGVEYEFNNAKFFNQFSFEKRQELFFGLKFELR